MSDVDVPAADNLRAWAKGIYTSEAACELLIRAFGGRFANPGHPWVAPGDPGAVWVDFAAITDTNIAALSGGEQRVLRVVASLGGGVSVDLNDAVTGLDQVTSELVLAAIAHASGWRLYPWPNRGVQ